MQFTASTKLVMNPQLCHRAVLRQILGIGVAVELGSLGKVSLSDPAMLASWGTHPQTVLKDSPPNGEVFLFTALTCFHQLCGNMIAKRGSIFTGTPSLSEIVLVLCVKIGRSHV